MTAVAVSILNPADADSERARLRASLEQHRLRTKAARILEEQASERAAIRAARADATAEQGGYSLRDLASGRRPNESALLARRRDQYRHALAYPMSGDELFAACLLALDDAGLPLDDDRSETLGALLLHVQRRHGKNPMRADVGRDWLRQRARGIYCNIAAKRKRRSDAVTVAAELQQWHADDDESAERPDTVMAIAENLPAREQEEDRPISADMLARLGLTAKQASALAYLLESQKRHTLALTNAEHNAAFQARRTLARTYPDAESIRVALHPNRAPSMAVEAAQTIERARATVAGSSGTHIAGGSPTMAHQMRPILRPGQHLTPEDRAETYRLTARDDRASRI